MPLALYFNSSKFPRTTTRKEWTKIWRWKRITEKVLAKEMEARREELADRITNLSLYGTTHPEIWDSFINPPLLVHDKQEL